MITGAGAACGALELGDGAGFNTKTRKKRIPEGLGLANFKVFAG